MFFDEIQRANFKLLDSLTGEEQVGIDKKGHLYTVVKKEKAAVLSQKQKGQLNQLGLDYALSHLSDHEFHEISRGTEAYNNLVKKLTSLHIFSDEDKSAFAYMWYGQRYQDLVGSGILKFVAEGQITIEMSCDPNILPAHKEIFSPEPTGTQVGISGSYFIRDREGKRIGVFKPMDEEPYMPNNPNPGYQAAYDAVFPRCWVRTGQRQGEGWKKEAVAWELDQDHFVGVPYTCVMEVTFPKSRGSSEIISKRGSFQQFVEGKPLTELTNAEVVKIPASEIHKMAIFDLMVGNSDRHFGNFFWDSSAQQIRPIDHGLILLDSMDWSVGKTPRSEGKFEWQILEQAKQPVDAEAKKWALEYDVEGSCRLLRQRGISEGSIREHRLRVIFIQEGIRQGFSLDKLAKMSSQSSEKGELTVLEEIASFCQKKVAIVKDQIRLRLIMEKLFG